MADATRTFFALELPADRREKLGRLQGLIAPDFPGARWLALDQMHLTLAFLGEIPHTELKGVCLAVAAAVATQPALELRIEGLGVFPDANRPRVVWAGVLGLNPEGLSNLQRALVAAVTAAGYPPTDDRFHPHITLGRIKIGRGVEPPGNLEPLLGHYRKWSAGTFRAGEVAAFASILGPDGAEYTRLARAPLAMPRSA